MTADGLLHANLTGGIIGAFYDVYNELGYGFAEAVYGRAMQLLLRERGLPFQTEVPLTIHWRGHVLGTFRADLIVGGAVLVELKACDRLAGVHEAQVLNYLRASGLEVGLLLNFGQKAEKRRYAWTQHRSIQKFRDIP